MEIKKKIYVNELSEINPVSDYAVIKREAEKYIIKKSDEMFKPIIFRTATLFGYSPRMRFDLVVNKFVCDALTKQIISVEGGNQWRPLLHVEDAANGYCLALEKNFDKCEIFNLGINDLNYKIKEIADIVKKNISGTEINITNKKTDLRNYKVSFDKIQKKLNFFAIILKVLSTGQFFIICSSVMLLITKYPYDVY